MWTILLAAAALPGCGESVKFKGVDERPADQRPIGPDQWPFRPVVMRLHPFTALHQPSDGGPFILEVRIELVDPAGDVTKGVGHFRFELYQTQPKASRAGEQLRLQQWDAPLTTLADNQAHYDPITRTYLFKFELDAPPPPKLVLFLLAQFDQPVGPRLSAEMQLPPANADNPQ